MTDEPQLYRSAEGDYLSRWKRVVFLDQRFRDGSFPNATELAGICGVSTKTIHRDIEAMRLELSAPIEFVKAENGYRYTDGDFAIPAATLSERNLFALMVAENAIANYEGTPLVEYLREAFGKILSVLPGDVREKHELGARAIRFGGLPAPRIRPDVWNSVARAIRDQRAIDVMYRKPGKPSGTRALHPYLLVVRERDWFLIARDPDRDAVLTYYVPRIDSVTVLDEEFEIERDFSAAEYYRFGFNAMQSHADADEVVLHFASDAAHLAQERAWSPDQHVDVDHDGSARVRFHSSALFAIQRAVLQYGGEVTVEAPPALRDGVRSAAERIIASHG